MQSQPIDRIVLNGRITTMQAPGHEVEAFAVRQGRIVALGSTAEIRALAPHAEAIDCAGRRVLPGFVDSHCHPDMHGARLGRWHDLSSGLADRAALLALIERESRDRPRDHWFVGFRYDEGQLGGYPTLAELERAGGGRPVFLYRRDAHLGLASSAALAAVGYGEETADPPFGKLDRDPADGRLTGLLRETAAHAVVEHIQATYTPEQFAAGLETVFEGYASYGITSVHNSLCSTSGLVAYQQMREAGRLAMRVGLLASGREEELIRAIVRAGWRSGFGDEWVRLVGVEWCPDCSTSGRTAAYYTPYRGEKVLGEPEDNRGMLLYEAEDFARRVLEAHRAGLTVCADGVGDRGIDFVLDAFEAALAACPRPDHRMRVEHCCNVTPPILDRLKRLEVVCSSASGFAYDLGDAYVRVRGPEAMRHMWPHRSMIDAGVKAPGHSDSPVCHASPLRGIYSLVTRRSGGGQDLDAREAITLHEALEAYTTLGAWSGREEAIKGDLAPGKLADFQILEEDLLAVPPERIPEVRVAATYVGGDATFRRA